jgi:lipopolysaccharide exporter
MTNADAEKAAAAAAVVERERRIPQAARLTGMRRHAARGTIINAAFQIGLAGLQLVRRLMVAALLTASDFGVAGLLLATILVLVFVKNVGTVDKYVQQSEPDQERAFQKAFTIELLLGVLAVLLALVVVPAYALLYGRSEIVLPGLVASLALLGNSLQSPTWIYYREMDFVRQRALQAVDPSVAFVVTIGLAFAGAGYWSLVIGTVTGAFAGGIAALIACPYRLALRLDRGTAREYFKFSWPIAVAGGSGLLILQGMMLVATRAFGLAAAGAINLAGSITAFTDGVDAIVTQTLYPAICAVRDRTELLYEAFVKSNRLALMWGMPFGLGLALFASDLVHFVIGSKWESSIVVLQAFGVAAAIDQIGFNWSAFLRALDRTKPLAALAVLHLVAFATITVPLLIAFGLRGFAIGWLGAQVILLAGRTYYLTQLFAGFGFVRHAARAIGPTIPACALVLLARALESGGRTPAMAVAELLLFVGATVAATVFFERALLREMAGYLRRRAVGAAASS